MVKKKFIIEFHYRNETNGCIKESHVVVRGFESGKCYTFCNIVSYNISNWKYFLRVLKEFLRVLFVYINLKALPKKLNVMNWEELKNKST